MNRRLLPAFLAPVALLAALLPAGAHADDDHEKLTSSYTSLSASLVGLYAREADQDMSTYLAAQQLTLVPPAQTLGLSEATVPDPQTQPSPATEMTLPADPSGAAVPGIPATEPAELEFETLDVSALSSGSGLLLGASETSTLTGGITLSATDLAGLNAQLEDAGVDLNSKKFTSLNQLAKSVTRSARTPDGAVTLAGASWAKEVAQLKVPKLRDPKAGKAAIPGIPADALPFGLVMNKALTNMVTDFPDLITASKKNGTGQAQFLTAWKSSMAKAYSGSSKDLTELLPNSCVADMMAIMATGSPSSAKGVSNGTCDAGCIAAGQYMHSAAKSLVNPAGSGGFTNPTAGVLGSSTLNGVSDWSKSSVSGSTLSGTFGSMDGGGCSEASSAAKNTAKMKLPSAFAHLSR